jgi:hypothetical protein
MQNKEKDKEGTISLKDLSKEVFPELEEISAYRKTSKYFEKVCNQMGIDPKQFKPGRGYKIPIGSKQMWILLIRNLKVIEGEPSQKQFENFVNDLREIKDLMDEQHADKNDNAADSHSFIDSMTSIYESYYTASSHRDSIAALYHNEILEKIHRDFNYILENAPDDRVVFYTEFYYKQILDRAEKQSSLIRKMIKEKWNEK